MISFDITTQAVLWSC